MRVCSVAVGNSMARVFLKYCLSAGSVGHRHLGTSRRSSGDNASSRLRREVDLGPGFVSGEEWHHVFGRVRVEVVASSHELQALMAPTSVLR